MRRLNWIGLLLSVILVAACSPSPSAVPSPSEPPASEAAPPAGGFPAGCEPIVLVGPDGERVDLTGTWTGAPTLVAAEETALLNQVGGCVYASVDGVEADGARTVATLNGHLTADFLLETELVLVYQESVFPLGEYSTMVMAIEWDSDGRIRLREVRDDDASAGRCVTTTFECPAPAIWYRVD